MLKRGFDLLASSLGLLVAAPLLLPVMLLVWLQDFHNPLYISDRVGLGEKAFKMYKLRSMIFNADRTGVSSTSANDQRISRIGHFIRRYKLDELTQLLNVFLGDMSLVGPRPNVRAGTDVYTKVEKRLLSVRPGITDLASIVFADEGEILRDSQDPDRDYDLLIRPWKSRLALLSIDHQSFIFDFKILVLTAKAILSRAAALAGVVELLNVVRAPSDVIRVAARAEKLVPHAPPGAELKGEYAKT